MNTAHDPFEPYRLAVTLAEAQHHNDADQVCAILATVTEAETGAFFTAIAEMTFHAFHADPAAGFEAFTASYRQQLDAAALAYEQGQDPGSQE
ncbi:hypothetical protein [Paeniglutamicibacter sp.]|uniref:hypothetical protein n=1 Tax=Paeniglutamicibacter sp. TaxID=1934391 RepID=UPI003989B525